MPPWLDPPVARSAHNGEVPPDLPMFQRWLRQLASFESATVRSIQPVTGGASNLTYRADLDSAPMAAVALRLQRKEGIFQPYSVSREADVLRKLVPSPIPVPSVVGIEWDPEVLGARFLVLEWVEAPHLGEAGPEGDRGAYARMVAAIHGLDWRALGLDFLGVPAGPGSAALAELAPIARRIRAFELGDDPLLQRALAVLQRSRPHDSELAFCQGDINPYNYLFRAGEVVAVIDWEQAHIGDPRSDVAQMLALSHLRGTAFRPPEQMPFAITYAEASGEFPHGLEYFRALWLFNLAVIHHAWVRFNDTQPWYTRERVSELLGIAVDEIA